MPRGGGRITVAAGDDNASMRLALSAVVDADDELELLGVAEDGPALLELVADGRPDVVIADARMPLLDGIEVCAAVAARFPTVRTILYTGEDSERLFAAALDAGVDGFLVKSGSPEELGLAVRTVMRGERYVDASLAHLVRER